MSNTTNLTGTQIIEAANAGNWAVFETPFEYRDGAFTQTVDLTFAIEVAAQTVASGVQQDNRYAALSPEAGYDLIAPATAAARDGRVREEAIRLLAYDRVHKGY